MTVATQERSAQLCTLMAHVREHASFHGVILVAEQGVPLLCEAIGNAEISADHVRPLTTNSMFELASLSKPFTALGILRLHLMDKLQLDDPVAEWLPELPYPNITIRHLLTHTSGLPDYMQLFAEQWNPEQRAVNADVLDMLIAHRPYPLFPPGESWMYSNTGYIMLAILIERISGQSYAELLSEQIFQPLGMTRTRVYNRRMNPGAVPEDFAWGYVYRLEHGGYVLPDVVPELNYVDYLDGLQGDGMINSTVMDLLRLDRALYEDQLIPPQLREVMFAPVTLHNGETFDYGFGWLIEQHPQLGRAVGHSGGWPGYATQFKRYIEQDATVIFLQNGERGYAYTHQLLHRIEQILAGEPYDIPQPAAIPAIISLTAEDYEQFLGVYQIKDEQEQAIAVTVYVEQDHLYMRLNNNMRLRLFPISSLRFYEQQASTELEFSTAEAGKSMQFVWYDHGGENVAHRVE